MANLIDRSYPYLVAAIVAGLFFNFKVQFPDQDFGGLLSAAISFSAIIIGFLATAQTIMAGYLVNPDTPAGRVFSVNKYRSRLRSFMLEAFILLILFAAINMAGFFVPTVYRGVCLILIWVFFGVSGMLAFLRLYILMLQVITSKHN